MFSKDSLRRAYRKTDPLRRKIKKTLVRKELIEAALARLPIHEQDVLVSRARQRLAAIEESLFHAEDSFSTMMYTLLAYEDIRGKSMLEIGPGAKLIQSALLLAHGLGHYTAVDLYPAAVNEAAEDYKILREHLEACSTLFPSIAYFDQQKEVLKRFDDIVRLENGRVVFDETKMSYLQPVDAAELPLDDETFDICFSNVAFEHFSRPGEAIRESFRVLKRGGLGMHNIDYRDHANQNDRLDFLQYTEDEWLAKGYVSPLYTNRRRHGFFAKGFREAGFDVLWEGIVDRQKPTEQQLARLAPQFRDISPEELEILSALFVLRRPKD